MSEAGGMRALPIIVALALAVAILAAIIFLHDADRAPDTHVVVVPTSPAPDIPAQHPTPAVAGIPPTGQDLSMRIADAVRASYPALSDVRSQCDTLQCIVSAVATEPMGEAELMAYEDMIRTGLATAVKRAGVQFSEPAQIEEVGPNRFRLLMRTTLRGRTRQGATAVR